MPLPSLMTWSWAAEGKFRTSWPAGRKCGHLSPERGKLHGPVGPRGPRLEEWSHLKGGNKRSQNAPGRHTAPADPSGRQRQDPLCAFGAGFLPAREVSNFRSPPPCIPSGGQASHFPFRKGQSKRPGKALQGEMEGAGPRLAPSARSGPGPAAYRRGRTPARVPDLAPFSFTPPFNSTCPCLLRARLRAGSQLLGKRQASDTTDRSHYRLMGCSVPGQHQTTVSLDKVSSWLLPGILSPPQKAAPRPERFSRHL